MDDLSYDVSPSLDEFLEEILWDHAPAGAAVFATRILEYDPDEPRDERGRWTTGGGTALGASVLDPLALFDAKRAITDSITASAERIYQFLQNHPGLYSGAAIDAENAIADELHNLAVKYGVVDTNPKTAGWGDLFLGWLFEVGAKKWEFGPDAKTTQDMKKEVGIRNAIKEMKARLAAGDQRPYDTSWKYGVDEFWTSIRTVNTAEEFLGSYDIHIEKEKGDTIQITASNTTGWESGTRFRKAAAPGGAHQSVVRDRKRGDPGIHLGGTISQTWTWSEPCK